MSSAVVIDSAPQPSSIRFQEVPSALFQLRSFDTPNDAPLKVNTPPNALPSGPRLTAKFVTPDKIEIPHRDSLFDTSPIIPERTPSRAEAFAAPTVVANEEETAPPGSASSFRGIPLKYPIVAIAVIGVVALIIQWWMGYTAAQDAIDNTLRQYRAHVTAWFETFQEGKLQTLLVVSSALQALEQGGVASTGPLVAAVLRAACNTVHDDVSGFHVTAANGLHVMVVCDNATGYTFVNDTTTLQRFDSTMGKVGAPSYNARGFDSYAAAVGVPLGTGVMIARSPMASEPGVKGTSVAVVITPGTVLTTEMSEVAMGAALPKPSGPKEHRDMVLFMDGDRNVLAATPHMDPGLRAIVEALGIDTGTRVVFETVEWNSEVYFVTRSLIGIPKQLRSNSSYVIVCILPGSAFYAETRKIEYGILIGSVIALSMIIISMTFLMLSIARPLASMKSIVSKAMRNDAISTAELGTLTSCVAIREIHDVAQILTNVLQLHALYRAYTPQVVKESMSLMADGNPIANASPRKANASLAAQLSGNSFHRPSFDKSVTVNSLVRSTASVEENLNTSVQMTPNHSPSCGARRHGVAGSHHFTHFLLSQSQTALRSNEATVLVVQTFGLEEQFMNTPVHGVDMCTRFVSTTLRAMEKHTGVLVALNADSIMMAWNATSAHVAHEITGSACALTMVADMQVYDGPYGIGLVQGPIVVGNIGSHNHRAAANFGKTAVLAKDLPSLSRQLGARILINDKMNDRIKELFYTEIVDWVSDRANPLGVGVYELVGKRSLTLGAIGLDARQAYVEGFSAFHSADFATAETKLKRVTQACAGHSQAKRLLRLVAYLRGHPERVLKPYRRPAPCWAQYEDDARRSSSAAAVEEDVEADAEEGYLLQQAASMVFNTNPGLRAQLEDALAGTARRLPSNLGSSARRDSVTPPKALPAEEGQTPVPDPIEDDAWEDAPTSMVAKKLSDVMLDQPENVNNGSFILSTSFDNPEEAERKQEDTSPEPSPMPTLIALGKGRTYTLSATTLGRGSFGAVYLGLERSGALVAVKALPVQGHQAEFEALLNEVALMETIVHENVVQYFGSAVVGCTLFLVMECVIAGSLAILLDRFGTIPLDTTSRYIKDVLRGLVYLHEKNIVHHDIKPHNVLVTVGGVCKLTDFGASSVLAKVATGTTGSPLYMAPEVIKGEDTALGDVWSVGIMFLQLLTGKPPYDVDSSMNPSTFLYLLGSGSLLPVIPTDIDPKAQDFARRCLCPLAVRASVTELMVHPLLLR